MQSTESEKNAIARKPYPILAIPGSLRRDSFNLRLLECAKTVAPDSVELTIYRDMQSIPAFNEDIESSICASLDPVHDLRATVKSARGLLIATPEYNRSVPGQLKNVIDWLSRPTPDEVMKDKPIMIIGASSGPWGTRLSQSALRQILIATESLVMSRGELFVRNAGDAIGDDGLITNVNIVERIRTLMRAFCEWMDTVSAK